MVFQPSNSRVGWLGGSPGARWRLPAVQLTRVLAGWESLPDPAPALTVYLPLGVEILVGSVAVPALGLGDRALAPRPVHGLEGDNAVAVTRHAFPLPVCGLVAPENDECTCALGATALCSRSRRLYLCSLVVTRPGVTTRGHTGPAIGHLTVIVSCPLS